MLPPLARSGAPCGDDSHSTIPLRVSHDQEAAPSRVPLRDLARFVLGVIRVRERLCERVHDDGRGFLERNAVLPLVREGLFRIPLEPESSHRRDSGASAGRSARASGIGPRARSRAHRISLAASIEELTARSVPMRSLETRVRLSQRPAKISPTIRPALVAPRLITHFGDGARIKLDSPSEGTRPIRALDVGPSARPPAARSAR